MMAAPANPPIKVWEEEDGMPDHQVAKFQIMAATTPAKITGNVIYCSNTVLDTVFAIPKSLMMYFAMKNATKLKNAAQSTA